MDAETFKNIRRSTGLTIREFGVAMNPADPIDESRMTRWEKGTRRVTDTIADLAADVVDTMEDLVTDMVDATEAAHAAGVDPLPALVTHLDESTMEAVHAGSNITAAMHFLSTHRAAALLRADGLDVRVVVHPGD